LADERTKITELATAAGMMLGADHRDLDLLAALDIPGIPEEEWRPPLEAAAEDWHRYHGILRAALANGATFRETVLRSRDPDSIEWRGQHRTMWVSDAPVDLRVNDVYLVSAKYDSVCLLNRAPRSVFDELLATTSSGRGPNWYAEIAPAEYVDFYEALVSSLDASGGTPRDELPGAPEALTREARVHLKYGMKPWARTLPDDAKRAYERMCAVVSHETAERWRAALAKATEATKLGMLAQMIRLCGTVYWLLGQAGERPVRCRVGDAVELRRAYRLRSFDISVPSAVGQPRVDWRAVLEPRAGAAARVERSVVAGFCEVRWSHGKFQGNPECKVQLRTPVWQLPGYTPFDGDDEGRLAFEM
jgi:hypothetical protein